LYYNRPLKSDAVVFLLKIDLTSKHREKKLHRKMAAVLKIA
jgi:hypothetical protein